ncbi:MAG: hypothetical protein ORN27_08140 [Rhodoluna sp.]|nr:hypothetical protein [Rhodoluna sp.]
MVDRLKTKWWFAPLAIFLATRVVTTVIFLVAAWLQGKNYWTPAHPDYFSFLNIWDVEWYGRIFKDGYPVVLPVDQYGFVQQNSWAFLPLFPYLVKLTFLPWQFGAPLLASVFALLFALVAHRLFVRVIGVGSKANWALVFVLTCASSPVLQTGYAESLSLLGMALVLLGFVAKRYWISFSALVIVAFARPGVLAFAAMFGIIFLVRLLQRNSEDRVRLILLTAWSALLGFAWPLIAGAVTGRADAYYATELAWSYGYTGSTHFTPFSGFIIAFQNFFGGPIGVLIYVILAANLVYLFFAKEVIALGEVRWFAAGYLLYLFAVFYPQSSTWRLLLPLFVLGGALSLKAKGLWRWIILVFFVFTQVIWIWTCWMYAAPDFTPP